MNFKIQCFQQWPHPWNKWTTSQRDNLNEMPSFCWRSSRNFQNFGFQKLWLLSTLWRFQETISSLSFLLWCCVRFSWVLLEGHVSQGGYQTVLMSSPSFWASWKFGLRSAQRPVVRLSFWTQSAGDLDGPFATVCGEADGDTQTGLTRSLALCRVPPPPPSLLSCHLRVSF